MDCLAMILLTIPISYPLVMGLDFYGMSVPDIWFLFGIAGAEPVPCCV